MNMHDSNPIVYERRGIYIGECPSNSPFIKNNGAEVPKHMQK
jgi:hypothetical protein